MKTINVKFKPGDRVWVPGALHSFRVTSVAVYGDGYPTEYHVQHGAWPATYHEHEVFATPEEAYAPGASARAARAVKEGGAE